MIRRGCAAVVAAGLLTLDAAAQEPDYAPQVMEVANSELQSWITDPVLVFAIKEQNERHLTMSSGEVARLDRIWIAEDGHGPMTYDLLDRQASIILRDRRERSKGVITEIIVMDAYGLNVAISDATSDYFQGDEAKYKQTYLVGPDGVHISDIEFDESTLKVQTQVSLTVVDPDSRAPIGAVTFGVDLQVLSN